MKRAILLILSILPFLRGGVLAATPEVDSTLYIYYRWCNNHISDPSVLLKADTLFRLSVQKNDVRMQAVSQCLKADHYYFTNRLDSLKAWVPRVQAFARSKKQIKYYYFVWSRLILYYTKHSQYTLAQYELERYLEQAEKDDYKPATAEAYKQLGHIYRTRGLSKQAIEYYRKTLDEIDRYDLDRFAYAYLCSDLADLFIGSGRFEEAEQTIARGRAHLSLPEYDWILKLKESRLAAKTGRPTEARTIYRQIVQGHNGYLSELRLLENRLEIEISEQNYSAALGTVNRLVELNRQAGNNESYTLDLYYKLGLIHYNLGNYKIAYDNLNRYSKLYRQKVTDDNEHSLGEFATLLEVNRLDREKTELQQQAQEERLRRTRSIIIGMAVILLLAALFIVVLTHMNRRLARAKRAAEDASRMKDIFIRNITHEINTPLNAIVGFSELAATAENDDAERRSFLGIIRENSDYLRKLVDDVLYISDIESTETAPALAPTDILACCRQCIDSVRTSLNGEGPELRFLPACDPLTVRTSRLLVAKVLTELLVNASRFAPHGPITLAADLRNDRELIFTVTDSGPGIPAADADRIFERFVKLDPYTQGMGLGLSVCRLIARTLGGDIRLDTACTEGARFVFTVPVA